MLCLVCSEVTAFSDDVTGGHLTLVTCSGGDVCRKVQGGNLPAVVIISGTATSTLVMTSWLATVTPLPPLSEDTGETLLTNQDKEEGRDAELAGPAPGEHVKLEVTTKESHEFKVREEQSAPSVPSSEPVRDTDCGR